MRYLDKCHISQTIYYSIAFLVIPLIIKYVFYNFDTTAFSILMVNPILTYLIALYGAKKYGFKYSLVLLPGIVALIMTPLAFDFHGSIYCLVYIVVALIGATIAELDDLMMLDEMKIEITN